MASHLDSSPILRDVTERRRQARRTREALDAVLAMAQTLVALPHELSPDGTPEVVPATECVPDGDAARAAPTTRAQEPPEPPDARALTRPLTRH